MARHFEFDFTSEAFFRDPQAGVAQLRIQFNRLQYGDAFTNQHDDEAGALGIREDIAHHLEPIFTPQ